MEEKDYRKKIWCEMYIEAYKKTGDTETASKRATFALKEFDKVFPENFTTEDVS